MAATCSLPSPSCQRYVGSLVLPTSPTIRVSRVRLADPPTSIRRRNLSTVESITTKLRLPCTSPCLPKKLTRSVVWSFSSRKMYVSNYWIRPTRYTRQTDDIYPASLIDVLTDPYRFISARWQTVQAFPRLV